jgi:hypothetical protein
MNALEKQMLTQKAQQEWRKFPPRKRYTYRRQLLKRARELGIITPAIEEKLDGN